MLVTGGVRCGKSRWAEQHMLALDTPVTCVTPGYPADADADPEWAARVEAHRLARPSSWATVEEVDVAAALRAERGPVLVDCVGTWLTRQLDAVGWDSPRGAVVAELERRTADLAAAVADHPGPIVLVTNEVGWGVVPEHPSGRLFADLLGRANQALAGVCDDVVLLVAGRALHL
ncbi:MAG TPA: bifunctional adenosylcobinamide kinase/adenosylcobinamide-phosphate guanylyltransferase [Propionibacterium sp.]|nr:bifunctional adenosylcobinamide kinase/adenosylcobinamide-phosphate guanylyltransferase [Propionibacterium sp.]